jgi:hypothetical protein
MSASLARDRRPVEDLALDLPLIGATPPRQTTVNPIAADWILPLIGRAIDRVMQRKEAAITMGMDQAQMTRQLSGDGHLSIRKLGLMPEAFWLALIDELRAHFKLDDDSQRLDRALDGLTASVKVIAEIARKGLR